MGESDADSSGDVNDRKSTTGYYFKLNGRGAALSWGVKKQATVALSSSEAEYQGMAAAVQEALYLKQLLEDFGIQQKRPIAIGEGSGHLHKVLTRFESGSIQSSFDGNRLYAISSSLSGGVRISIKL